MASTKLAKYVVSSLRSLHASKRLGNGTISGLVTEAMKFYRNKHDECFVCPYHLKHVAGLELGKQLRVRELLAAGRPREPEGEWIGLRPSTIAMAKAMGKAQGMPARLVIEQAVLEHLTRPSQCDACPFYAAMCEKMLLKNRRA